MKALLILLLTIGACHCQLRCGSNEDIARILEIPPRKQNLEYLVNSAEKQALYLNDTLQREKPDGYPQDPITVQCSAAIIANNFGDIDLHVDDNKWPIEESTLEQYYALEKSFADGTATRVKRGLFGFFKKVVNGIKKIAQTIAKVVTVIKKIVDFALTVISVIKGIKAIFGFFG